MIPITDVEFRKLSSFIQKHYGIQLKKEKETLLIGRLHKIITELGFQTFTQYYDYLVNDKSGKALLVLVDKISTNHTFFMREPEHFNYLREVVLPYLHETVKDRDLRIWCAASSTGEEPYTLAMILHDYFGGLIPTWDKKLLATDISDSVLAFAKAGEYSKDRVGPLPPNWKTKYFDVKGTDTYKVKDLLKREVIYRRLNLMDEVFPFRKKFHVIFCRNVMIYFDQPTKDLLVDKFYDLLEPGGYLFIGHSESLNREKMKFNYIKPAVYRKGP